MRRCHPQCAKAYPNCTPIRKQAHKYTTSKSSRGVKSNVATVFQFPLILSFASTTHKIQGQTIVAPRKAAVDLRSVFGPNQAYVMLGRVQEKEQLFIIGSMPNNKITTDQEAKKQLEILKQKSLNKNPPVWEKLYGQISKVIYLNICSLLDKIEDVKADPILPYGDIIVLGETWLDPERDLFPALCQTNNNIVPNPSLHLDGYKLHLNSSGRGKGLAVYFKENKFATTQDIKREHLQITILESQDLCVVSLYRSDADRTLAAELKTIIPATGTCLVIGDFNLCTARSPKHEVFQTLRSMGFELLVTEATHFAGGHIDQAWLRNTTLKTTMQVYSPYYTCKDHDALLLSLYDPRTEQGRDFKNVFFSNQIFLGLAEDIQQPRFAPAKRVKKRTSKMNWDMLSEILFTKFPQGKVSQFQSLLVSSQRGGQPPHMR
jgi:hypothetical protein